MNILIVDDHPMVLNFYENMLLRDLQYTYRLNIVTSINCEEAYNAILWAAESENLFDLVILDHSLPPFHKEEIFSGADLAILLKGQQHPCKIIVITSHTETLVVYDILKKVNPEGLAIKNEITEESFSNMLASVLAENLYQSPHVKLCVKQIWKKEMMAEENNRQILIHLSKGYKVSEMEGILNLAGRTIERRISEIRKTFNVTDNASLVKAAILEGFL